MNKQLENRISSREVAEMMEMEHSKLLRKIDDINEDFRESKIGFSKYWIESSYKVKGNNKTYKEYLITKRGCEFLAHKTTGKKGNLFTDKYMDRFAMMEQVIKEGVKPKEIDSSIKEKEIEARYNNSLVRKANLLLKIAKENPNLSKEYIQVLQSKATEIITGQEILPLPVVEEKTYSATEIGERLGISANKVGKLANAHNLKTERYGKFFHDKSKYSNKEVETFRYYENVIPVLETLLNQYRVV